MMLLSNIATENVDYFQICRNINRIKVCMETGQTVILLNLENLYESLYDALNQVRVCDALNQVRDCYALNHFRVCDALKQVRVCDPPVIHVRV